MKIIFTVYQIVNKEVCVPSDDYYARDNDWQTSTIEALEKISEFTTKNEALELIGTFSKGTFTILETITK